MSLIINKIFHSIQGQGRWSGTPAVFVRLQGCVVGCPWCNEKATWPTGGVVITVAEVVERVRSYGAKHAIITGGEPLEQDIGPLVTALAEDHRVQIETSGTSHLPAVPAWITLAPKFGMRRPMIVWSGMDEIKVMVGKQADIDAALPLIERNPDVPVYLQPISSAPKATAICVEAAMRRNWAVSVQLHKMLGMP